MLQKLAGLYKARQNQKLIRKGYSPYYVSTLLREMKNSYKNSTLPKAEIKWAEKRGFKPFRIAQYGLTEENYKSIISDDDYYWLHPLNPLFASSWVDDKLTIRYTLYPFKQFLPEYYYQSYNGTLLKLLDCTDEYSEDVDGLIKLLRNKGELAAKLMVGGSGVGFYKLEFKDNKYYVNNEVKPDSEIKDFLSGLDNYLFTEFIEMHPDLKKLYPGIVNTIRVAVINEDGKNPIIPFSFMRIGTKASGIVDNTAQGGMFCKVDVEKGRFYDGETCINHVITPVKNHPDTGEPVEGIIPHWELVKKTLTEIGHYMPQLKWLGYDIAITPDGFKIIEINSHQGLHKAHLFPDEVKGFLNRELERKRKRYGK